MSRNLINGKVSIIVPCYNVEDFIEECLDSLVRQTYENIEVIMVDDGSPDNTGNILDDYDDRYENFKAVHTPNGGLSAARNAGLDYVTGEFLAFVDSDDIVPLEAYEKLVGSLLQTGSDMASGFVKRFNSKKVYPSILHEKAIPETVLKTHINENTNLVYDTTAWNKVYRSAVFLDNGLKYPVNLTYEDIPVSMRFHLLAKSVDIIAEDTYHWRVREGANQSITQQRANFKLFWDRMQTLELARHSILELDGSEALKEAFNYKVLDMDIPIYLNGFQNASEETLFRFQQDLVKFLRNYDLTVISQLSIRKQIQYRSLLRGDFKNFKRYGYQYNNIGKIELHNNKYKYINNVLPKAILEEINFQNTLESKQKINRIFWKEDKVVIRGQWFIKQIAKFTHFNFKFITKIFNEENGNSEDISSNFVIKRKRKRIFWGSHYYSFEIEFDAESIAKKIGIGKWIIKIEGKDQNISFSETLGHPIKRSKSILRPKKFILKDTECIYTNDFNKNWDLVFNVSKNEKDISRKSTWIENFNLDNTKLSFDAFLSEDIEKPLFILSNGKENDDVHANSVFIRNEGRRYLSKIEFDLTDLECGISGRKLKFYDANSKGRFLYEFPMNERLLFLNSNGYRVSVNTTHRTGITMTLIKMSAYVSNVRIHENLLHLRFTLNEAMSIKDIKSIKLVMVSTNQKESYDDFDLVKITDTEFEVDICVKEGDIPLFKKGYYNFNLDIVTNTKDVRIPIMQDNHTLRETLTADSVDNIFMKLQVNDVGRFQLALFQKWDWIDNTKRKRKISYYILYPLMRLLPLKKKVVVFESFWGRSFDDNPKAIYDYWKEAHSDYTFIWPVSDLAVQVDSPGKTIRRGSFKYWYYLATAKYLIQNTNLPNSYVKRNGQIEVETLHGTFMKKMGLEEPSMKRSSAKGQRDFMKRNSRWDYLISPSEYMDKIGAKAFDFQNKVLSVGFPRNDELINNNNIDFIVELKRKNNIPLDKKVVLYAPTYRQAGKLDFELDLMKMREKLSDDYVILVRLHHLVANAIDIHEFDGFAFDMSSYPNIADLYLISDVLITDYSSVMFDYGYLQRPMIFFAYDLDWYLDDTNRGVYLDYVNTVPGPIVKETEQIIDYLTDFEELQNKYKVVIEDFYDKFCTYGRDGDASKRTVETIINTPLEKDNGEKGYFEKKLAHALGVSSLNLAAVNFFGKILKRKNIIVFEDNNGNSASDSPRAMYDYLSKENEGYKLVWIANKESVDRFKSETIPFVIKDSFKGIIVRARAKYLITNSDIPVNWKKPQGMKVIQTTKGSPLKKIGTDVSSDFIPGKTIYQYQKSQVMLGRKWDYLIVGNELTSDLEKNAYRLNNNQIVMSGLPRNDSLRNYKVEELNEIRAELGIQNYSKVVLYEPTWRDNEIVYVDQYGVESKIDFDLLSSKLPNDVVVLVRFHPIISVGKPVLTHLNNILDVSDWGNNVDLLAVADLLITDYSSVMFDYAITKKPMIFMAPDVEEYQNYVRGLYINDYQEFVPGPVVKTTNELIETLDSWSKLDVVWEEYRQMVHDFDRKYNTWNDGESAKKAIDYIFNHSSYSVLSVDNPVNTVELTDGTLMWSGVYGQKDTRFIGNIDLSERNKNVFKVVETKVLKDPINDIQVGNYFFKINIDGRDVWIAEENSD